MKLWSSVRGQAEKMAFEADKLVRIKKEESAMGEVRNQLQAKQVSLGEVALGLFRSGALANPEIAALAGEIAALEAKIAEYEARIAAIRAEQPKGAEAAEGQAAAAVEGQAAAAVEPAPATAAAPTEAPRAKFCPNCGKPVAPGAAFCGECGAKLGA